MNATKDRKTPYFLVLDEMNLSHVERYFADFLSAMESEESIPLHSNDDEKIPWELEYTNESISYWYCECRRNYIYVQS